MMMPTGSAYYVAVEPPQVDRAQCTGTSQLVETGGFPQTRVQIDGKAGGPTDPISGTSNLAFGDTKGTITYKLTPK